MAIDSIKPCYTIEKADIIKHEEKLKPQEEKLKTEYKSSLEAMSNAAQGGLKSRFYNMQVIRVPQILSNAEKYLSEAKSKKNEAEELVKYAQDRIRQLKITPGNKGEFLNERQSNGNTLAISYSRGKHNTIKINSIKVTKQDGITEFFDFSPLGNDISQIFVRTKKQSGELEKLYKYTDNPTTIYIKKKSKNSELSQKYSFNNQSLSTFDNQIKTQKSLFNEYFKLDEGKIIDFNAGSKKLNQ